MEIDPKVFLDLIENSTRATTACAEAMRELRVAVDKVGSGLTEVNGYPKATYEAIAGLKVTLIKASVAMSTLTALVGWATGKFL